MSQNRKYHCFSQKLSNILVILNTQVHAQQISAQRNRLVLCLTDFVGTCTTSIRQPLVMMMQQVVVPGKRQ